MLKLKMVEGKEKCKDVFDKYVLIGQLLEIDDVQSEKSYWFLYLNQIQVLLFVYIFMIEDLLFVDEFECCYFGKLIVDIFKYGFDKEVLFSFIFGGIEFKV